MDKLTLTRQFGIRFGIFLGGIGKELEWNNIDLYRYIYTDTEEKVLYWFKRCTYGIGIEKEEKTEDFK